MGEDRDTEELDGTSELHPKSTSRLVEWCYNYDRLMQMIIYHAVTRICFENSHFCLRSRLGLDLSAVLECSNAAAAKN